MEILGKHLQALLSKSFAEALPLSTCRRQMCGHFQCWKRL
ncbi:unnamed protein product, partial [Vitis vinifera]|uniref:Uncharacterized protein n=1 Tax=Vitis vinifera TaxID=29760 RepID=D7T5M3_VITVI